MDLISIIVPVYNVEKYLDKCIESIVNQTYDNLEIILVDDGSTDNSGQMCEDWARKDNRIKVIHKKNGGLSDARNVGIENASGAYIGMVDSDDIIAATMFEDLYKGIISNDGDIAQCLMYKFNEHNDVSFPKSSSLCEVYTCYDAIINLLIENKFSVTCPNLLLKSGIAKKIKFEIGRRNEDILWSFRTFSLAENIVYLNKYLYGYYQRSGSIMHSDYSDKNFDELYALQQRASEIKEKIPELYSLAVRGYIGNIMYHYQSLCRSNKNEKQIAFQKKLHSLFCDADLKSAFETTEFIYKLWYSMFKIIPKLTCKIRNTLKIGL